MSLEKYFTNRTNVHDMSTEKPKEQGFVFDPEKEILAKDWKEIKALVENGDLSEGDYAQLASDTKLACPSRFERDIELGKTFERQLMGLIAESKNKIDNEINDGAPISRQRELLRSHINHLYDYKMLYPEKFHELNVSDEYCEKMKESCENLLEEEKYSDFLYLDFSLKLIIPDLTLPDNIRDKIKEELAEIKQEMGLDFWVTIAAEARVLFPNDNNLWEMTDKEELELRKLFKNEKNKWHLAKSALSLKILTAQEVDVTHDGLEIIMKKDLKKGDEESPLPIKRKF